MDKPKAIEKEESWRLSQIEKQLAAYPCKNLPVERDFAEEWTDGSMAVPTLRSMVLTLGIKCSFGFTIDPFFCSHTPANISFGYQQARSLRPST